MANSPKKSAAAAAATAVSAPAMERAIEAASVVEPTVAAVEPEWTPAIASTPEVETPTVLETLPVVEAVPAASVVEVTTAPAAEIAPVVEAASVSTTESAAHPFAAVSKILEAPIASLTQAQGKVRDLVETSLSDTHSKYTQLKSAADEAAQALETSYATVKNGAVQFNVKAIEALSDTAHANFDFFKSVLSVKSPSDYVALQTEFARKQIELATAQTKAFGELAKKVATETVEPIKAQVAKTFNIP
jgi:phasin